MDGEEQAAEPTGQSVWRYAKATRAHVVIDAAAYFELIQPRLGEGRLEDARPPRFANLVGLVVLSGASLAYGAGFTTIGAALGLLVAALALLAAATGFCAGCSAYKLGYRLTGRTFVSCPLPPLP